MAMDVATLGIRVDATEARLAAIELERLSTAGGKTAQSMSAVDKATRLLAGAFAGITAIELAKSIISTNMAMESLRAQLTALTGSALGSEKAFNFIKDFATSTPFEIDGVTKSFIMLQNFGIKPTIGVMNALTNQAAKLGGAQETLAGITLALGQAYSKGKLQAEEMNQMIERGVPVYQILQELTGKNSAALQDMAHKGEITRDVMDGFIQKMGELASGGNAAAMETLRGKISNLSDAWHQFEDALLQDKSESIMKTIVDGWTYMINDFTANLNRGTGSFGEIEKINNKIIAQKEVIRRLNDGQGMIPESERPEKIAAANSELQKLLESRRQEVIKYHDVIAAENTRAEGTKKFNETVKEQAEQSQKQTKTLEHLTDTNYKLTHSQVEYNRHILEAQGFKGEDLEKALKLANANDALSASNKGVASETKAAAREQAQLAKSFDDTIKALSLNIVEQSQSKRQLEEATLASKLFNKAQIEQVMVLWDAKEALIAKKKLHEDEKAQLDSLIDRYNKATMSARDYYSSTLTTTGTDGQKIPIPAQDKAPILAQFDKTTGAEAAKKAQEDAKTTLDAYNKSLDDAKTKTQDLGGITTAIFDGALGGISLMTGALTTMTDSLAENSKAMAELNKNQLLNNSIADPKEKAANFKKYAKEEAALNAKNVQDQMTGTRQLAGAASKMFAEKSAGAKAFHAIEVGIAVAQLAMRAKDMAMSAIATVKNIAEGASKMFAQSGWLGFAGVAAMLALMAGLGAMSKGGGSGSSTQPPTDTGTGTVLGDPTAVSESIGKTNELLKTIHASEYVELRGINRGVNGLEKGIADAVSGIFKNGGLATVTLSPASLSGLGAAFSKMHFLGMDPVSKFLGNFLFGGKVTQSIVAQGIGTNKTSLSDVINGGNVKAYQFADIKTHTSGGLFTSSSDSYSTQTQKVSAAVQESLNSIFSNIGKTMLSVGKTLGDAIGQSLEEKVLASAIPAMRINLLGLNGEAAAKKVNGVISATLDKMSSKLFGDLVKKYQHLGEGMLETTVRIVSEITIVKDALKQSGLSLLAKDVIAVSDAIVQAAGGLEQFQTLFENYYDKFYSESEKTARLNERLTGSLAEVGLKLADTRAGYRAQIDALDMTNALDQQRYSTLLELSSAADQYYASLESVRNSMKLMTQDNFKSAFDYKKYLNLASLSGIQSASDLLGLGTNTFIPTGQAAVGQLPTVSLPTASDTPISVAISAVADSNSAVVTEVRALRVEQQAQALAIAQNSADTARIMKRWDGDGMPAVRTTV